MNAEQKEDMARAAQYQRQAVLWFILAAGIFTLAVGYPLGLFSLL
jgi:hypothetical protein